MNIIKNFFLRLKTTLFSDEYEHIPINFDTQDVGLEIDRFSQGDPYAISKYDVPLMHYYGRDCNTIRKKCEKDKTLNLKEEQNKLLNRYLFIGTEQKNRETDKYDIVSNYRQEILNLFFTYIN